jgi:hypothetical protein
LLRRSALLGLVACTFACRGDRGADVSTPSIPDVPVAVRPAEGGAVDSQTPSLVVLNARGFDAGQATYEFLVLDAAGTRVVQDIKDVAAGNGQTEGAVPAPLERGRAYQWKAVAHAGDRTAESKAVAFEIAVPCTPGDPYAKAVVDVFLSDCARRTNRRALLDPRSVLGPPDARGNSDETYSGILSLGEDGYVTVDMGVCIADQPGPDLRVFQYVQFEGVGVDVSGSADGPWVDLGTQACGDGGTGDRSNHCDFDLAGSGLKSARYVRVSDGERYPCARAGTRSEGADIDAVQALHVRN